MQKNKMRPFIPNEESYQRIFGECVLCKCDVKHGRKKPMRKYPEMTKEHVMEHGYTNGEAILFRALYLISQAVESGEE